MLIVSWVQAEPSVDGIRIRWPKEDKSRDIPIGAISIEANKKEARTEVTYTAPFYFEPDSEEMKMFSERGPASVSLLSGSNVISNLLTIRVVQFRLPENKSDHP